MAPTRHNSTISAAGFTGFGNVASLRTQVSRTTFKVGLGAAQGEAAVLLLDSGDGFRAGHRLAGVRAVGAGEFGGEFEAHQFAADYRFRLHSRKVACAGGA